MHERKIKMLRGAIEDSRDSAIREVDHAAKSAIDVIESLYEERLKVLNELEEELIKTVPTNPLGVLA